MNRAIFNKDHVSVLTPELVAEVKKKAVTAELRRFRYCFHHAPNEPVNEMIIAFCLDSYVQPHRHVRDKSESYHLIEGKLAVFIFDDDGSIERRIDLGAPGEGLPIMYHLSYGKWHAPVPLTDPVVIHETFGGSFDPEMDIEYAPWAPSSDQTNEASSFVSELLKTHPEAF